MDTENRKAWEKLSKESSKGWACFQEFLRLPVPRTLAAAAKATGRSRTQMKSYSSKYSWQSRAEAWDEELAKRERQATIAERERIGREHRESARLMRTLGTSNLVALAARQKKGQEKNDEFMVLSSAEARCLTKDGIELERGLIREAIEQEVGDTLGGEYDTSALNEEELTTLLGLMRKMESAGGNVCQ